jgi:predicted ATPase
MIEIREIKEPECKLYDYADNLVGVIRSLLQLNDIRIQLMEENQKGYYIIWEEKRIDIDENGTCSEWPYGFYDMEERQLWKLLGWRKNV